MVVGGPLPLEQIKETEEEENQSALNPAVNLAFLLNSCANHLHDLSMTTGGGGNVDSHFASVNKTAGGGGQGGTAA